MRWRAFYSAQILMQWPRTASNQPWCETILCVTIPHVHALQHCLDHPPCTTHITLLSWPSPMYMHAPSSCSSVQIVMSMLASSPSTLLDFGWRMCLLVFIYSNTRTVLGHKIFHKLIVNCLKEKVTSDASKKRDIINIFWTCKKYVEFLTAWA